MTSCAGVPQPVTIWPRMSKATATVGRPEEDPGEAHDVERDQPADDPPARPERPEPGGFAPQHPHPLQHQPAALDGPPHHERPAGAVPQPAEEHGEEQVDAGPQLALPVAAEPDVQVVAQPAGQRHVPAAPEVLQRAGGVRRVEVLRELDAEEQGEADGDVGVAGEVGVDLDGVGVDADQVVDRAVLGRVVEDRLHDPGGQLLGDDHLLGQAEHDQPEGPGGVDLAGVGPDPRHLRHELADPHDRPGHQVGEERQVGGEVQQRDRPEMPAVGVDHVADGLEHEERHADRQDDVDQRQRAVQHAVDPADDPLGVLEPDQHRQVGGHGDQDQDPSELAPGSGDGVGEGLVAEGQRGQQEAVATVVDVEPPPRRRRCSWRPAGTPSSGSRRAGGARPPRTRPGRTARTGGWGRPQRRRW